MTKEALFLCVIVALAGCQPTAEPKRALRLAAPAPAPTPSDAYAQAVLQDKPVGYWRLGESSGTALADSSGHNHPAVIADPSDFAMGQSSLLGPSQDPWTCGLCGDANGDRAVTITDALFIAQFTVGMRSTLPCPIQANVAPPAAITITDALFICQFTVGMRPTLPCSTLVTP